MLKTIWNALESLTRPLLCEYKFYIIFWNIDSDLEKEAFLKFESNIGPN